MGRSKSRPDPRRAKVATFSFVSGGVDSTVAYTLYLRALGQAFMEPTWTQA
jgi:NH3-dependent NAD+ synthetase